jgi:hypothetical protein
MPTQKPRIALTVPDDLNELLGIYTKSQSSRSTGDFQQSQIKRLERFILQEISSRLLPKERVKT